MLFILFNSIPLQLVCLLGLPVLLSLCLHFHQGSLYLCKKYDIQQEKTFLLLFPWLLLACAAYFIFWVYLFSPATGKIISFLALAFASLSIKRNYVYLYRLWQSRDPFATSLVLMSLTCLFEVGFLELYRLSPDWPSEAQRRWLPLPGDNEIPFHFAKKLFQQQDLHFVVDQWASGERPALLTGMYLLFSPFLSGIWYQFVGVFFQTLWIPSLMALGLSLKFSIKKTLFSLFFMLLTGFILVNGTYSWPKIQSGAFFIISLIGLINLSDSRNPNTFKQSFILIGGGLSFCFLSHSGGLLAFPIFALLFIYVFFQSIKSKTDILFILKSTSLGMFLFILALASWKWYSTHYSAPSQQLLQMHLAGQPNAEASLGFLEALKIAYSQLTLEQWLYHKFENLKVLFEIPWASGSDLRNRDFFNTLNTLGLAIFGLLTLLVKILNPAGQIAKSKILGVLITGILIAIGVWVAIMFEPGSTLIHQGAYAWILLLLYFGFYDLPLQKVLLFMHGLYFFYAYWGYPGFAFPGISNNPQLNFFSVLTILLSLTIWYRIVHRFGTTEND